MLQIERKQVLFQLLVQDRETLQPRQADDWTFWLQGDGTVAYFPPGSDGVEPEIEYSFEAWLDNIGEEDWIPASMDPLESTRTRRAFRLELESEDGDKEFVWLWTTGEVTIGLSTEGADWWPSLWYALFEEGARYKGWGLMGLEPGPHLAKPE